jgi:hypothetical protein
VAMSVFCSSHVVVSLGRLTLTGRGVSTERCVGSRIARVKIRRFVGAASGNLGALPTGIAFCKRDDARTLRRLACPPLRHRSSIAAVEHAICAGSSVQSRFAIIFMGTSMQKLCVDSTAALCIAAFLLAYAPQVEAARWALSSAMPCPWRSSSSSPLTILFKPLSTYFSLFCRS